MKIYVAGKYQDSDKIRIVFDELRGLGHEITLDWTNHDIYPNDTTEEVLGRFANDDVNGVKVADALVGCLMDEHNYKGLWVEMGVALGKGIPVFLVGNAGDSCIFVNHHLVRKFKSFPELYDYLSPQS